MLNIDDRLIKQVLPKIKPNAFSVLLAIAIHLNKQSGRCFPSHRRLMELTGLGRDAVYSALETLKKENLLRSNQAIDSKTKAFGRRTFTVTTRFISIFVTAEDAEPLTENPDTADPDTADPDTANQETKQLNKFELINNDEHLNNERERTPARAEISETLEAEKNKRGFVAPPAESAAPPPTHMVTEVDLSAPATRLVSPFTMPNRAKSLIEAEKFIMEWVDENIETVKYRHETAGRVFNQSEMPATIAHYCSVYAGTNDASRERLMRNPVQHFSDGLFKYLKNQTQFDRKSDTRSAQNGQKQTTTSTIPLSLQNKIGR